MLFQHPSIPQRVVHQHETALLHARKQHFVVLQISPLVRIHKSHVPLYIHLRHQIHGVANVQMDTVGIFAVLEPRTHKVFHLVKDLERMKFGSGLESLGHAQRAVTAERAQLHYHVRCNHLHQHLQQTALQMAACHLSVSQPQLGIAPKGVKVFALCVNVVQYVLVQFLCHSSVSDFVRIASMASL